VIGDEEEEEEEEENNNSNNNKKGGKGGPRDKKRFKKGKTKAEPTTGFVSRKVLNEKMANFLELFAQFTKPRALHKSKELKAVFTRLVGNFHPNIEKLALRCLCTWNESFMVNYRENLERYVISLLVHHISD